MLILSDNLLPVKYISPRFRQGHLAGNARKVGLLNSIKIGPVPIFYFPLAGDSGGTESVANQTFQTSTIGCAPTASVLTSIETNESFFSG